MNRDPQPCGDDGCPHPDVIKHWPYAKNMTPDRITCTGCGWLVPKVPVVAWLHWCGSATPGDPRDEQDNTRDGLPAPFCGGCRAEVPLHRLRDGEVVLLIVGPDQLDSKPRQQHIAERLVQEVFKP